MSNHFLFTCSLWLDSSTTRTEIWGLNCFTESLISLYYLLQLFSLSGVLEFICSRLNLSGEYRGNIIAIISESNQICSSSLRYISHLVTKKTLTFHTVSVRLLCRHLINIFFSSSDYIAMKCISPFKLL